MAPKRSEELKRNKKESKASNKDPNTQKAEEKTIELAMKILEKEHQLEKSQNPLVVHELIAIYSEAIEYYSQINDMRYIDLQSRMHKILMRPEVLETIQTESRSAKPDQVASKKVAEKQPSDEEPQIERLSKSFEKEIDLEKIEEIFEKQAEVSKPAEPRRHNSSLINPDMSNKINSTSLSSPALPNKKKLNIILDRHTKTNKNTINRAAADFKSQDNALERRLATRQKVKLGQSASFASSNSVENSAIYTNDEEDGENNKTKCFIVEELDESEKFEKMLEEIMEINYSQRAAKVAEIKLKYEGQINEMAGMGDFMKAVVEQMRANMQDEINSTILEFENRKKEQIAALKIDV